MKRHSEPRAVWYAKRRGLEVVVAGVVAMLCVAVIFAVALR